MEPLGEADQRLIISFLCNWIMRRYTAGFHFGQTLANAAWEMDLGDYDNATEVFSYATYDYLTSIRL